jgi:hypothetical protein
LDFGRGTKTSGRIVLKFVRGLGRLVLLALFLGPTAASAQQQPVNGCAASPSCRQNGFSALTGNSHLLVSLGIAWDPGFHLGIIPAPAHSVTEPVATQRFHLDASALSRAAEAAPVLTPPNLLPAPAPTPTPRADSPRD